MSCNWSDSKYILLSSRRETTIDGFVTKNTLIYETLRDEIIEGRFRADERIVILDVAKRYGVSAIPIREALNRLHQDRLVMIVPHVGARVISYSPSLLREALAVSAELEALALRISIPFMNRLRADMLQPIYDEMKECAAETTRTKKSKLEHKFYSSVYSAASHPVLDELRVSFWCQIEFFKNCLNYLEGSMQSSLASYQACLEAMRAGNGLEASRILRKLKEDSIAQLLSEIEKE